MRFDDDSSDFVHNHAFRFYFYHYFSYSFSDISRVKMMILDSNSMNLHYLVSYHLHVVVTKPMTNFWCIVNVADDDVIAVPTNNHNLITVHC